MGFVGEEPAGQVVFVPARVDQDDGGAGCSAREEDGPVPLPDAVALGWAGGVVVAFEGVVDDAEVEALAGEAASDAGGDHAAAYGGPTLLFQVEPVRGVGGGVQLDAEDGGVLAELVADPSAVVVGEVGPVRRDHHPVLGVASQVPERSPP